MENISQLLNDYLGFEPLLVWVISLLIGLVIYLFIKLLVLQEVLKKTNRANTIDSTPKPKTQPIVQSKPEPSRKPELDAVCEPEPTYEVKPEVMPTPQSRPKVEAKSGPGSESKPTTKIETKTDIKIITERIADPKTDVTKIPISGEKTRIKEKLPQAKEETEKAQSSIHKVNYSATREECLDYFPILRFPKRGTVVRSHRLGSTKRRGYKEESFENAIKTHFGKDFNVFGDIRINTGRETRPFEPDIAIIAKNNKSLCIDIEIDEPYAGITRQPTHCKGEDTMRDIYFTDRGWLVIRFSEYQIHTTEGKCLRFIAEVIKSVNPQFNIPTSLGNFQPIPNENLWNTVQAQKWEKDKYRENYLNHEFRNIEEAPETIERGFNEQEEKEERLVVSSSIGVVDNTPLAGFNIKNTHPRDGRIRFYPEPHIYTIDNTPAPSASTLISRFFPEFDLEYWSRQKAPGLGMTPSAVAKMWKDRGQEAAEKGTYLHEQIEKYYLKQEYDQVEGFHLFEKFVEDHPHINPFRSEWRVFDDEYHIAGTIDLISKNGIGYEIYDWKRSKKTVNPYSGLPITDNNWQQGIGGLCDIDDTSYNRYCLQQSLYRYMLEKNYDVTISKMFLVVLYPDYDNYHKLEVPYQKDKVEYILRTL